MYRNWFQDYTVATITALLQGHGFRIANASGDLAGAPYGNTSACIGVIARTR